MIFFVGLTLSKTTFPNMKLFLSGLLLTESDFERGRQLLHAEVVVVVSATAAAAAGCVVDTATVIWAESLHSSTNPSWKLIARKLAVCV